MRLVCIWGDGSGQREEKIQLRERGDSSKKAFGCSDISKKASPRTAAKVEGGSVDLGGGKVS